MPWRVSRMFARDRTRSPWCTGLVPAARWLFTQQVTVKAWLALNAAKPGTPRARAWRGDSTARPVAAPDQLSAGATVGTGRGEGECVAVYGPAVGGGVLRSAPEATLLIGRVEDVVVDGTGDGDRRALVEAVGVD